MPPPPLDARWHRRRCRRRRTGAKPGRSADRRLGRRRRAFRSALHAARRDRPPRAGGEPERSGGNGRHAAPRAAFPGASLRPALRRLRRDRGRIHRAGGHASDPRRRRQPDAIAWPARARRDGRWLDETASGLDARRGETRRWRVCHRQRRRRACRPAGASCVRNDGRTSNRAWRDICIRRRA